jgi:2-polyprenyl-6-methoxyphenol hydroxylase-like FAD-dependent oxidoreductase
VTIDCAYASGFLPRSADDLDGSFLVCASSPPTSFRVAAALPVEGDRWMVTFAGVHGDVPGTTEEDVRGFARSLLSPAVAQLLERAGPLSSVASYRFPCSQRRHYEQVRRLLPGFVTLGDAACSFNPIYGQGMSCAALQADALGDTIRAVGLRSDDLPRLFHRRASRIIDAPWAIAVGADFLHPQTTGPKARGTDQMNAYVLRVVRASHTSVRLARSFNLVLNLVAPPSSLARPSVVAGVLASSWPGRRRRGAVAHPRVGPPGTEAATT